MLSVVRSALVILSSLIFRATVFRSFVSLSLFHIMLEIPRSRHTEQTETVIWIRNWFVHIIEIYWRALFCLFVFSFCFLRFHRHTVSHSAHARPSKTRQYLHKQQKRQERIAKPSSVGNGCQISHSYVEDLWNDWRRTSNWISSGGQKCFRKCEITMLSMETI